MKNSRSRDTKPEGGFGDASLPPSHKISRDTTPPSSSENDDFLFGLGHYGDPHSFAFYQLFLLLVDFIFNWTIDLAHEDPLAVLVIFVFQSLAMIINLILYIMASASQAMQVGLHKRVTIHHWLNLVVCLLYMALTGWWFIWALRKSWPSVSDQFSFTWPAASLQPINGSSTSVVNNGSFRGRSMTRRSTTPTNENNVAPLPPMINEIVKEHHTLWSNGFLALYVCHRTVAILYYFIYLRATFLVLNTPEIDKFVEKKHLFVEKLLETGKVENKENKLCKSRRKKRNLFTSTYHMEDGLPHNPPFSLGLQEYLSAESSKFAVENEESRQNVSQSNEGTQKKSKGKRQILWADDQNRRNSHSEEVKRIDSDEDMEVRPVNVRKKKTTRSREWENEQRQEEEDTVRDYGAPRRSDDDEDEEDEEGIDGREEEVQVERFRKEKTRSRERTKPSRKFSRRGSREEVEFS